MAQLRDYQLDLVRKTERAFANGLRRIIIQLPTGGGKTVLMAELVKRQGSRRILYVVPSIEIFDQTAAKLNAVGIRPTLLQAGKAPDLRNARCVLAMSQTLAQRLLNGVFNTWSPDLVIVDEAHRLLDQHQTVLRLFRCPSIALTATPVRLDGKSLAAIWPTMIQGPQIYDLIEKRNLVPMTTYHLPLTDLKKVRIRAGDYETSSLSAAYENSRAADLSAIYWSKYAKDRPTIAFAPSRKVSQTLADAVSTLGMSAVHLDGSTPKREREKALEAFAQGEIDFISNCGLFVEGLDVPHVSCIVVCTSTLSLPKWLQMCGQGTRPAPGKRDLLILDHGHCAVRLGTPDCDRDWYIGGAPL